MTLIVKNANLTNIAKTTSAVAEYIKTYGGRQRVTVEWLSQKGCKVYSAGEKDSMVINIKG